MNDFLGSSERYDFTKKSICNGFCIERVITLDELYEFCNEYVKDNFCGYDCVPGFCEYIEEKLNGS